MASTSAIKLLTKSSYYTSHYFIPDYTASKIYYVIIPTLEENPKLNVPLQKEGKEKPKLF